MSSNHTIAKRMSYQPEYVFGSIPDANGRWTGEYGLKPWPAHLQTRHGATESTGSSEPTAFLAVTPSMKKRLAATCEALIALLDEIDGDENLEDTADDEPLLGWPNGRRPTAEMSSDDDREHDDCDLEPEPSGYGDEDGMLAEEWGEPDLGFCGHGTGVSEGETADDREEDAGDDREVENEHGDDGEHDLPEFIPGGGSVSQHEDGWRPDPNYIQPVKKQKRGKQPDTTSPTVLFRRDEADSTPMPRYMWNDQWTGKLPPEAHETIVPQASMHRASK